MHHRALAMLFCVALSCCCRTESRADLVKTFSLVPDAPPTSDTQTFLSTGLQYDGITFDAQLTVTGSDKLSKFIGDQQGLSVKGITSAGEWLSFSLEILNATGGEIQFKGFTAIDFDGLALGAGDTPPYGPTSAIIGSDSTYQAGMELWEDVGPEADQVDLTFASPETFYAISPPSSGGTFDNAFTVRSVTASFSNGLAAVPEPSGFLFGGLVASALGGLAMRRRGRAPAP